MAEEAIYRYGNRCKTLGLIGFGRIGQRLADKALALGMKVIFHRRTQNFVYEGCTQKQGRGPARSGFRYLDSYCRRKPEVGAEEMELMKDSAYIINCSRGGVVDENALVDAIEAGKRHAAMVWMFVTEPTISAFVLS